MGIFELIMHRSDLDYEEYWDIKQQFGDENHLNFVALKEILGNKKAENIQKECNTIEYTLEKMGKLGIEYMDVTDKDYPEFLTIMPNPCYLLYYKGNINLLKDFSIGIIGSRRPTPYGKYAANLFSSELSKKGVTIISGFAAGIDSESHKAATGVGGKTIGVLGTTLDNIYPKSNTKYADEILASGNLLISEFRHDMLTLPHHFVQRNRLISALSDGLLIVEAGEKSGTLTTVDHALDQGKMIFAIPGNINSKNSYGTNKLIKSGAKIVTEAEDILEEYPFVQFKQEAAYACEVSEEERKVVEIINEKGVLTNEEIAFFTKINIKYIIGILSVMEIKGIVKDLGNNSYMLV